MKVNLQASIEGIGATLRAEGATRHGAEKLRDELLWKIAADVRRVGPSAVSRETVAKLVAVEIFLASPDAPTD